ncbi:bifunctional diguanylate cyclase/phosphodiesterase [Azovibrio restrictus]|uniref:putative bifunctional diguanylate cyclase/phosphodiesterase n=1 Tax=Azovibrio restrictus TaxID=146938 RepID=UPI0026E9D2B1|nr:GGDEF and EAL domain-containing protein [Azovibrio restrictus]MDD3481319.1 EAL domain-containing protein [Azovibrio restrictus]
MSLAVAPMEPGRRLALGLALLYLASGLAWVALGRGMLAPWLELGGHLEGLKDGFFLLLSSLLVYGLFRCRRGGCSLPLPCIGEASDERRQRLAAAVFSATQEGIVITDLEGRVEAVNPAFCTITGYEEAELLGENMRILKSDRQEPAFYQAMWQTLMLTGQWQGEIWNRRKDGEIYPEWLTISTVRDGEDAPINYVGVFLDISQIKTSEQRLQHLAQHDPLTGLPNRQLFLSRLEHALERSVRQQCSGAVLILDLDQFKHVNDSLGHPAGDELLQVVASRLRRSLRDQDTLARLGGDEFLILLEDQRDAEGVAIVAEKLLQSLAQPFHISSGNEVYMGASIGICLYPQDGDHAATLIQHADSALYQAKALGRSTSCFYNEDQTRRADARLSLEAALRRGLENGEFRLYYQPQVDLLNGQLVGVEALVRWQRSDGVLVCPDDFIPLAEETGLILPLGDWVLEEACRQTQSWLTAGYGLERVAVNLSPLQFRQANLVQRIEAALARTGLAPTRLELEITESMLMDGGPADSDVARKLHALERQGIRLAIDDFGTGYSSLAYLKRFPLHVLKVDRSFVRDILADPVSPKIVTAILDLGRNLELEIMAEGVENRAQRDFLLAHGCRTCQGFLYSRPIPAGELERYWLPGDAAGR